VPWLFLQFHVFSWLFLKFTQFIIKLTEPTTDISRKEQVAAMDIEHFVGWCQTQLINNVWVRVYSLRCGRYFLAKKLYNYRVRDCLFSGKSLMLSKLQ